MAGSWPKHVDDQIGRQRRYRKLAVTIRHHWCEWMISYGVSRRQAIERLPVRRAAFAQDLQQKTATVDMSERPRHDRPPSRMMGVLILLFLLAFPDRRWRAVLARGHQVQGTDPLADLRPMLDAFALAALARGRMH